VSPSFFSGGRRNSHAILFDIPCDNDPGGTIDMRVSCDSSFSYQACGTSIRGDLSVPPGQTKDHGPNISGNGTSFYANGQFKWKFLITGEVDKDKNNVANLTLREAKTHKETKATATLKSPSYDTMDFVVVWPKGLTAKATLKRKS
jgi:hypothetical protein